MNKDTFETLKNIEKQVIQNSWNDYTYIVPLNANNNDILVQELDKYVQSVAQAEDVSIIDVKFFEEYQIITVLKKIKKINTKVNLHTNIKYSDNKIICDIAKTKMGFITIDNRALPIDIPIVIELNDLPIDIYSFSINDKEIVFSFKLNIEKIVILVKNSIGSNFNVLTISENITKVTESLNLNLDAKAIQEITRKIAAKLIFNNIF